MVFLWLSIIPRPFFSSPCVLRCPRRDDVADRDEADALALQADLFPGTHSGGEDLEEQVVSGGVVLPTR